MTERQAGGKWTPAQGPLGELTAASVERARLAEAGRHQLEETIRELMSPPSLRDALRGGQVAIIAELKRRSPSRGVINDSIPAGNRAAEYVRGGAAAISVLTEASRFGGSLEDLREVRAAVRVPLLRKDFVTAEIQLMEARAAGAAAVLLIARALEPGRLDELAAAAQAWGLGTLVEVRSEPEMVRALEIRDAVIGVNNRNLETLEIEEEVGARLVPLVPADRLAVYESGVRGMADVEHAAAIGADAVLVGTLLSTSSDGAAAVRALCAVRRRSRA